MRQEQAAEQLRLEQARAEVARLKAREDSLLHDSATIERIARERFGLIREGERLYRFVGEDSTADSTGRQAPRSKEQ